MRPELALRRKVVLLERKKALLDALITFLQKHPRFANETLLKQFGTRTILHFEGYAIIKPMWVKEHVALRLEEYSEDMYDDPDYAPYERSDRTVHEDITNLSDEELDRILKELESYEQYAGDET